VIVSSLEVLDNGASKTDTPDPLVQGVALVRQQFLATLEGLGVTRVDPLGQRFDPVQHEAVSTVPAASSDRDDIVIGVVRPGHLDVTPIAPLARGG